MSFDDPLIASPPTAAAPNGNGHPKSLVTKLAEVMAAVERVAKRGHNDFHQYDYATEADIAAAIRGELAARNIMLIPGVDRHEREKVGEKGTVLTTLGMTFTFLDGDSGEVITRPWLGSGSDKDDKGAYKAMTGGEKTFLLKTFLIPTGNDPERDTDKGSGKTQERPSRGIAEVPAAGPKDDVPLHYVAPSESDDPRPRFREGTDMACPNCKRRVFKRKDGSAWFCWQQKGGCGMQWSNRDVDQSTGEVFQPSAPEPEDDREYLVLGVARKVKECKPPLNEQELMSLSLTYLGGKSEKQATTDQLRKCYGFLMDPIAVPQWRVELTYPSVREPRT